MERFRQEWLRRKLGEEIPVYFAGQLDLLVRIILAVLLVLTTFIIPIEIIYLIAVVRFEIL